MWQKSYYSSTRGLLNKLGFVIITCIYFFRVASFLSQGCNGNIIQPLLKILLSPGKAKIFNKATDPGEIYIIISLVMTI